MKELKIIEQDIVKFASDIPNELAAKFNIVFADLNEVSMVEESQKDIDICTEDMFTVLQLQILYLKME